MSGGKEFSIDLLTLACKMCAELIQYTLLAYDKLGTQIENDDESV